MLNGLGGNDEALALLERAYHEGSTMLSYLDRDPVSILCASQRASRICCAA
ncbi:MAG: hypothetical protein ACRENP_16190 [Longimicrobiales bacterium]